MADLLLINRPIDATLANLVVAQLLRRGGPGPSEIVVYLDCPGGSLSGGLAIYDALASFGGSVATYCAGRAGGVAALLLAAGRPGRRTASPRASVLLRFEPGGEPATLVAGLRRRLADALARLSGQPLDRVQADLQQGLELDAEGARAYGLVDEIVAGPPLDR